MEPEAVGEGVVLSKQCTSHGRWLVAYGLLNGSSMSILEVHVGAYLYAGTHAAIYQCLMHDTYLLF